MRRKTSWGVKACSSAGVLFQELELSHGSVRCQSRLRNPWIRSQITTPRQESRGSTTRHESDDFRLPTSEKSHDPKVESDTRPAPVVAVWVPWVAACSWTRSGPRCHPGRSTDGDSTCRLEEVDGCDGSVGSRRRYWIVGVTLSAGVVLYFSWLPPPRCPATPRRGFES